MKYNKLLIITVSVLIGTIAAACSKGDKSENGEIEEARIVLLAGPTRAAGNAFEAQEDEVRSMRMLIFEHLSGKFYKNIKYSSFSTTQQINITIPTGRYDFVFVANEDADSGVAHLLASMSDGSNISDIQGCYFTSETVHNSGLIPMAAAIRNVHIMGDDQLILHDSDGNVEKTVSGKWQVAIDRLAVKINLTLSTVSETQKNGFVELKVANVPNKIFLMEKRLDGTINDNSGVIEINQPFIAGNRTFSKTAGDRYDPTKAAGFRIVPESASADWVQTDKSGAMRYEWYKRLILPALEFTSTGDAAQDKSKAIRFYVNAADPDNNRLGYMRNLTGYSLPRNYIYEFSGLIGDRTEVEIDRVTVEDWDKKDVEL